MEAQPVVNSASFPRDESTAEEDEGPSPDPGVDATRDQSSLSKDHQPLRTATQEDAELDAILNSALNDFRQPTVPSKEDNSACASSLSSSAAAPSSAQSKAESTSSSCSGQTEEEQIPDFGQFPNVDDVLKSFIDQDPQLKKHWEQLAESCSKAAQATTDEEFEASLSDTLKNLTENAKSIADNSDISEEDLSKIWSNLGLNEGSVPFADLNGAASGGEGGGMLPDIMPLVTNMMQNLLSKDVLYPALKDLTTKYPEWLEDNKDKVSAEDLKRYIRQLDLMEEVCRHFESEKPEDNEDKKRERFQQVLVVMQKMQECGSPPKDLVGDVPELGAPGSGEFDFSKIPGFPQNSGAQCSLM